MPAACSALPRMVTRPAIFPLPCSEATMAASEAPVPARSALTETGPLTEPVLTSWEISRFEVITRPLMLGVPRLTTRPFWMVKLPP